MRTDGTQISNEAISDFRNFIKNEHGKDYLPDSYSFYLSRRDEFLDRTAKPA